MKTIIVMRHAKAESNSPTDNDFDRRLQKKGIFAIKNTAKRIRGLKLKPDLIITSPVVRAKSTAQLIADFFDVNQKILFANYLYNRLYTFREILNDVIVSDNDSNTIIIVGHNPSISYLLQQINESCSQQLRTSSAVVFDFEVNTWSEVSALNSKMRCFINRID